MSASDMIVLGIFFCALGVIALIVTQILLWIWKKHM